MHEKGNPELPAALISTDLPLNEIVAMIDGFIDDEIIDYNTACEILDEFDIHTG